MPANREVIFKTSHGNFYVELFSDTPVTTQNFLNLVTADHYNGTTFFNRLVPGFVLQGGNFYVTGNTINQTTGVTPIINESGHHVNAIGTIAMARTADLNSATDAFYFNTGDNSASLTDYAVFGQVIQGWDTTVAALTALPNYNFSGSLGASFANLPIDHGVNPNNATVADLVYFSVTVAADAASDQLAVGKAGTVTANLFANDTDLDDTSFAIAAINGNAVTIGSTITLPSGAKLTLNANGTVTYDPNHVYDALTTTGDHHLANDSFTYTLADGSLADGTATVSITIAGTSATGETLIGTPNSDTLTGHAGDDFIDGLGGADALHGNGGNDTYIVDQQGDLVYEFPNDGNDTVVASSNYYLYPYVENLVLAKGAGDIFGVGNAQDNVITGNEGANTLLGGDGSDTVHAGAGIDIVYGEAGNDHLFGEDGNDYLAGGAGDDEMDGGAGGDSVYGEAGNDVLHGGTGFTFDQLVGGDGNDLLYGNEGGGDYDYLYGNAGDDTYFVDTPADLTFEQPGEGTDTVIAGITGAGYYLYDNVENLTLVGDTPFGVGNASDNYLRGSEANNWLLGGAGNDILDGGRGNDVLFGEAGADWFRFTGVPDQDVIGDFQPGVDKIDLTYALGFSSFADVQSHMVENNGNTAIDLGRGSFIVINGITNAQLHASDFVFMNASAGNSPAPASAGQSVTVTPPAAESPAIDRDDLFAPAAWGGAGTPHGAMLDHVYL